MSKSKIEWTDYTWNPVWGCKANCDYCYARNIAKRFAKQITINQLKYLNFNDLNMQEYAGNRIYSNLNNFKPQWLIANYERKLPKKPKRIFVGSMSDIAFWEMNWIYSVAKKMKQYPQHTFLLLTKFPKIYFGIYELFPKNVIFGITIDNSKQVALAYDFFDTKLALEFQSNEPLFDTFISFEPLLLNDILPQCEANIRDTDWVIVGTMSGRKRTPAKIDVITDIVNVAKRHKKPVFVKQLEITGKVEKDILKFPKHLRLREFPKLKQS